MQLYAGTSGFSYKEWKGPFYPAELSDKGLLEYYAGQLPSVEINNTFYRMPRAEMLAGWRDRVPERFRFALKAPQRITHRERLEGSADSLAYFWKNAGSLADRLGPVLFQLPPSLKADPPAGGIDRLRRFVDELPPGMHAAFEFRHPSWNDPAVFEVLAAAGCALCIADNDPEEGEETAVPPAVVATTDWGYLRLRRAEYSDAELAAWAERVRPQPWREVFVFFKHEDAGAAPRMALRMAATWQ